MTLRNDIMDYAEKNPGFEAYQICGHMQRKKKDTDCLRIHKTLDDLVDGKALIVRKEQLDGRRFRSRFWPNSAGNEENGRASAAKTADRPVPRLRPDAEGRWF